MSTTHLVTNAPHEDELDPVISPDHTYATATDKITTIVRRPLSLSWVFGFGIAFMGLMLFNTAVTWLFIWGVGVWGVNIPVAWGFAITNFVWWIGIGHAGTFISAFLLLLRQEWRTSINRFAEAMTILHLGRPWFFYFLFPYPNTMNLWPQFRSPLVWDVFAVSTYGTVSLVFWYVGLIPDLATLRDDARQSRAARTLYGFFALGWRGASRHWHRYHKAYLLLAGLAAPLVVSVHSVVGMDFASAVVPGWHSTIFPPYFVAGAIYSGFAMVVTLAVPMRAIYGLQDMITLKHLDGCAKLMLVTGLIVCYGYYTENFMAWYSGSVYEMGMTHWSSATASSPSSSGPPASAAPPGSSSSPPSSSTSACGSNGSSSSANPCTTIISPPPGKCTTRRSGTGPPSSAPWACSSRSSSSSAATCP
jgi:molybdopterin-containing oxidoreductase family membrane subunit